MQKIKIEEEKIRMRKIFNILIKLYGKNNYTELNYFNKYQLLVAIILSAQSTDKQVNAISKNLFQILKEPKDAIILGTDKINDLIKKINYHNVKAKYVYKMSEQIVNTFDGKIPNEFDNLIKLSGVGRKTANVFLNIAYNKNTIGVDTHVHRVSNRLSLVKSNTPFDTEKQLSKIVPIEYHRIINHLFILFGREYCKAIKPHCKACPLSFLCKNGVNL